MTSTAVPPKGDATSKATRLLCAGAYLDPGFRKAVIRELLTFRFRVVAPAYGYDAVSVLAHALAAEQLRRVQALAVALGAFVILVLMYAGPLNPVIGWLLFFWLVWGSAYLRRIAVLQVLIRRLRPEQVGGEFDGGYPLTHRLTPDLVAKIDREQTSDQGLVRFGGYWPFVGAGNRMGGWANTELLLGAPVNVLEKRVGQPVPDRRDADEPQQQARKDVKAFTVDEITSYVTDHMTRQLRDDAPVGERIQGLTIERRSYGTANQVLDGVSGGTPSSTASGPNEDYHAAREYLCIRIGSWDQELVTSMFVGFDLRGNTLHTEFYTYLLAPIRGSFHLVDGLPAGLDGGLLLRLAWDVLKSAPGATLRLTAKFTEWVFSALHGSPLRRANLRRLIESVDTSEFGLARYARVEWSPGAHTSIREMAMSDTYHVFFQSADRTKYTQIVQRRLLQVVRTFLVEHNVDTQDHDAHQTNILNQTIGDKANFGTGNVSYDNQGQQTQGDNSPIGKKEKH